MSNLKTCRACGLDYPLDEFYPTKYNKDGRVSYCKSCSRKKVKAHYKKRHFVSQTEGVKVCRACERELPMTEFHEAHYLVDGRNSICKECVNNQARDRRENPEHKESALLASKKWKEKNKPTLVKYQRLWRENNRDKIRADAHNRFMNDPNYRMATLLRSRVHDILKTKGNRKLDKMASLLGCSIDELRVKLQEKFQPVMTWSNYGKWHIDHILPCASFDLSTIEEQRRCFHFSNLQPLWAKDNLSKGARITLS